MILQLFSWISGTAIEHNSGSGGNEYDPLQASQSPHRPDLMIARQTSTEIVRRHSNSGENMIARHQSEPRPDITCTPYIPSSTNTSMSSSLGSASVPTGSSTSSGYPGCLGGPYYSSNTSSQPYLSSSMPILHYPSLYPQQSQLSIFDPRMQANAEQFAGGGVVAGSSYSGRELVNAGHAHPSMMGGHMGENEEHLHNDRYMSTGGNRGSVQSDLSMWRPFNNRS